jgi:hypothetical protein
VRGDHLAPGIVLDRREMDLARVAVDRIQRAVEIAIAPAMVVTAKADLVEIGVERAGRDLMQQRLLDMRAVAVDDNDIEPFAPVACA